VDAYIATPEFSDLLHRSVERLVAINDTAASLMPVDVVVNGSVGAERLVYRVAPGTLLLLGAQYALIEPTFAGLPSHRPGGFVGWRDRSSDLQGLGGGP
jgi:spore coat polysaccharide biosynthesis predicted glycosyltransferase SpsG